MIVENREAAPRIASASVGGAPVPRNITFASPRAKRIAALAFAGAVFALVGCSTEKAAPDSQAPETQPSPTETPASTSDAPSEESKLPDIEARLFRVGTEKLSSPGEVFLFTRLAATPPPPGSQFATIPAERKLIMLKRGDENVMAFRVFKDLPQGDQVVAKKIREYGNIATLPMAEEFIAVEKISDVIPPPPSEQDKKDIKEVSPPAPFDADLDQGTSPRPKSEADPEDSDDESLGRAIEDTEANDPHRNWLSMQLGMLRNTPGGPASFSLYAAGGIRYGYTLVQHIFFDGGKSYDGLAAEGGIFYYKIVNIQAAGGDSYTIMPLTATLRYTYFASEEFGFSVYGGFMRNQVVANQAPTNTDPSDATFQQTISNLGLLLPAIGVGAYFRFGPGWYFRADLGSDMIAGGISLRF